MKEQTQLEEDLAVMSRILEKTASERPGGQPYGAKAMGIDIFYTPAATVVPLIGDRMALR
jgi:hypothetical protein